MMLLSVAAPHAHGWLHSLPLLFGGFQIGPRIRIGGTLGKIGQTVKTTVGKVASNPITEGIAGTFLGPEAAAALGAVGKALDTTHGSVSLGDIAGGGLEGGLAGEAGSVLKGVAQQGLGSLPGVSQLQGVLNAIKGGGGSVGSGLESIVQQGAKFFGGGGSNGGGLDLGSLAKGGLTAAAVADAAANRARATDLQNQAIDMTKQGVQSATDAYNANAPVRDAGRSMALAPNSPDLSSIFANPGNVYTVGRAVPTNLPRTAPTAPTPGAA